ncbi:L-serine ammonia-lyase [Bryocella elongata]|uniref:L-serine ammonia-lyase n=2 Tax=Bryocella elongata TaxID=863522 RepID=A0A1H5X0S5_9BACT|nr:L-serine ammonia-lyase [Bryocella elongata]
MERAAPYNGASGGCMQTSLFELFKIGIGPSSSHTVGPMRAALAFVRELARRAEYGSRITVDLYGSLALTGVGHATDRAIVMGLLEESPDTVDLDGIEARIDALKESKTLTLLGKHAIAFDPATDLRFHRDRMYPDGVETHPNGMRFATLDEAGAVLFEQVYYSIGGGFILTAEEFANKASAAGDRVVPYRFTSAAQLLQLGVEHGKTIAEMVLANEVALLSDATIARRIDRIVSPFRPGNEAPPSLESMTPEEQIEAAVLTLWRAMEDSIERGKQTEGTLPGGLNVRRRAPGLARRLARMDEAGAHRDPLAPLDDVTLAAMAVNEENAAGGRVVTAPTNGAAGVVPAVAYYFLRHASHGLSDIEKERGLLRYFLASAAIGVLYKENASISGAEVGCQGEVGVACSMAAGGLVAALGGDNDAVEHAAEIGMEHNLGMTCDPIAGLVQIPCIERNGMGAVKAVNASRLAMNDPGVHKISLDQIIDTMYRTGMDMQSRYKETSLAGLALNIIEC